jgi:hypothetical protein
MSGSARGDPYPLAVLVSSTVRSVDAPQPPQKSLSADGGRRSSSQLYVALVLLLAALVAFVVMEVLRGVDPVETVAVGLFGFVGVLAARRLSLGLVGAMIATFCYALLRRNSLDLAASSEVNRMILGRGFGYVTFAAVVGVAVRVLRDALRNTSGNAVGKAHGSTEKLGLDEFSRRDANAAQELFEREVDRAKRHHRPLSVITIDLTESDTEIELGQGLRSSDYVLRGSGDSAGEVTLILPETDRDGASEIVRRFDGAVTTKVISLLPAADSAVTQEPSDDEVARLRARVATSNVF